MSQAVERATSLGIEPQVAEAVCAAFVKLSQRTGRAFDPAGWSRTVWLAEADRFRRAASPEAHYNLLLHLDRLRVEWEEKAGRGARGWSAGAIGERLTKR